MPFWKKDSKGAGVDQSKLSFRQKLRRSKGPSGDSRRTDDGPRPTAAPPQLVASKHNAVSPTTTRIDELHEISPHTQKSDLTRTTITTVAPKVAPANILPVATKTTVKLARQTSPNPAPKLAPPAQASVAEVVPPIRQYQPPAQHQGPVLAPKPPKLSNHIETIPCYCRHGTKIRTSAKKQTSQRPTCISCGRCPACTSEALSGPHPKCKDCRNRSPLLSLPVELHQEITSYLNFADQWLLRLTSTYFYSLLPAPIGPLTHVEIRSFYHLIRQLVPRNLGYCCQCIRYHSCTYKDAYKWCPGGGSPPRYFCLRDLDRTGRQPPENEISLGDTHFVCRNCLHVRRNRQCQTCGDCEVCAGVTISKISPECIPCDFGKTRCMQCTRVRHPRPGCERCGRCEACANCLFQFGDRLCRSCGGSPRSDIPKTRRVRVEQGPGYEMFYHDPTASVGGRERKIGVRQ